MVGGKQKFAQINRG